LCCVLVACFAVQLASYAGLQLANRLALTANTLYTVVVHFARLDLKGNGMTYKSKFLDNTPLNGLRATLDTVDMTEWLNEMAKVFNIKPVTVAQLVDSVNADPNAVVYYNGEDEPELRTIGDIYGTWGEEHDCSANDFGTGSLANVYATTEADVITVIEVIDDASFNANMALKGFMTNAAE